MVYYTGRVRWALSLSKIEAKSTLAENNNGWRLDPLKKINPNLIFDPFQIVEPRLGVLEIAVKFFGMVPFQPLEKYTI